MAAMDERKIPGPDTLGPKFYPPEEMPVPPKKKPAPILPPPVLRPAETPLPPGSQPEGAAPRPQSTPMPPGAVPQQEDLLGVIRQVLVEGRECLAGDKPVHDPAVLQGQLQKLEAAQKKLAQEAITSPGAAQLASANQETIAEVGGIIGELAALNQRLGVGDTKFGLAIRKVDEMIQQSRSRAAAPPASSAPASPPAGTSAAVPTPGAPPANASTTAPSTAAPPASLPAAATPGADRHTLLWEQTRTSIAASLEQGQLRPINLEVLADPAKFRQFADPQSSILPQPIMISEIPFGNYPPQLTAFYRYVLFQAQSSVDNNSANKDGFDLRIALTEYDAANTRLSAAVRSKDKVLTIFFEQLKNGSPEALMAFEIPFDPALKSAFTAAIDGTQDGQQRFLAELVKRAKDPSASLAR